MNNQNIENNNKYKKKKTKKHENIIRKTEGEREEQEK